MAVTIRYKRKFTPPPTENKEAVTDDSELARSLAAKRAARREANKSIAQIRRQSAATTASAKQPRGPYGATPQLQQALEQMQREMDSWQTQQTTEEKTENNN